MQYQATCLSALALSLVATAGIAQDRWSGAYMGLSLDGLSSTANVGTNTTHRYGSDDTSLGLYIGRNYSNGTGFVWGPEIGFTGLSSAGTQTDAALGTTGGDGSFLLTPRVRAGWANDRTYFYGSAGFGLSDLGVSPAGDTDTNITIGLSLGVGAEMAFSDQWSGRIEVTHHDLGDATRTFNGSSQAVAKDIDVISLGLSRKF